jgi:hypothetical protein
MAPLELSADQVSQLLSLGGSRALPHSILQLAQIVLRYPPSENLPGIRP